LLLPVYVISGEITGTIAHDTDTDHDIAFGAGSCLDSTRAVLMTNTAIVRQIDAEFGTGNGGMYVGGTVAANTTYYMIKIMKTDGTVNIYFDTSKIASNIPAGYTYYRVIGVGRTDSSSNWRQGKWWREGNKIYFNNYVKINSRAWTIFGTTNRINVAMDVPANSFALTSFTLTGSGTTNAAYVNPKYMTDNAPNTTDDYLLSSSQDVVFSDKYIETDSSSEIAIRASNAGCYCSLTTVGWYDNL
ncbi:MAG: hypothetical protein WC389_03690, partial [Lutibacter sp.]